MAQNISTTGLLFKSVVSENEYFLATSIGEKFAYGCAYYIGVYEPKLNSFRKFFGLKSKRTHIRIVMAEETRQLNRAEWSPVKNLDVVYKYDHRTLEYVSIMRSDVVELYKGNDEFWVVGQQYQKRFHLGHDERYTVLAVGKHTVFMRHLGSERIREVVISKDKDNWVKR